MILLLFLDLLDILSLWLAKGSAYSRRLFQLLSVWTMHAVGLTTLMLIVGEVTYVAEATHWFWHFWLLILEVFEACSLLFSVFHPHADVFVIIFLVKVAWKKGIGIYLLARVFLFELLADNFGRNYWWSSSLLVHCLPVDVFEERMVLDFLGTL